MIDLNLPLDPCTNLLSLSSIFDIISCWILNLDCIKDFVSRLWFGCIDWWSLKIYEPEDDKNLEYLWCLGGVDLLQGWELERTPCSRSHFVAGCHSSKRELPSWWYQFLSVCLQIKTHLQLNQIAQLICHHLQLLLHVVCMSLCKQTGLMINEMKNYSEKMKSSHPSGMEKSKTVVSGADNNINNKYIND